MEQKPKLIASWVLQILVAALFLMAAFPKLTGDPMATAMIDQLGVGSWPGPVIGLAELAAAVLLVIPKTVAYGGVLGLLILVGAIFSHLTVLGISLGEDDGGSMFTMALVGLVLSAIIVYLRRATFAPLLQKA